MAEIVSILHEETMTVCSFRTTFRSFIAPAPSHAGRAYTVGYMRALVVARGPGEAKHDPGDGTPKKREARIEAVIPA